MLSRRHLLASAGAYPMLASLPAHAAPAVRRRVRPSDADWPAPAEWNALRREVGGSLTALAQPLADCSTAPDGDACRQLFRELKNPYFIGDNAALTQTCGWVGAWSAQPSAYAVAARNASDVVAAVNFARRHNLRLVVKGGGHSYLGTSNAPDSLLIWTRAMDAIVLHDGFVPRGLEGHQAPQPAVSIGAGAIWERVYANVTTEAGRYVHGGGCLTVGVAGLVQGGGFGSYSKQFGLASASLLEAEVVTADGALRVVNAGSEPDLLWALKGGGGGTFGVVTRLTLRTWPLPIQFGVTSLSIRAATDAAYRRLIGEFVAFYAATLCTPHWGELARVGPDNRLRIGMNFQGLDPAEATALWQPFLDRVAASPDLSMTQPQIRGGPMRHRWDETAFERAAPDAIGHDDRPGAPAANFFWTANRAEAGHVIHGFDSLWLPATLLQPARLPQLADALMAASRHWSIEMHFQKGLAGAPPDVRAAARATPMNPAVADAFMLAIIASEGPPAFPGLAGHAPNFAKARSDAVRIERATAELRAVAPDSGAYLAESSYFQDDWQRAYWGANYPRLRAIKQRYDPDGLFFVRHGVGSEAWSEDGFTRLA